MKKSLLLAAFCFFVCATFAQDPAPEDIAFKTHPNGHRGIGNESVQASFNTTSLIISISNFTGNITVQVRNSDNVVMIDDTQPVVVSAHLEYGISNWLPDTYELDIYIGETRYYGGFLLE